MDYIINATIMITESNDTTIFKDMLSSSENIQNFYRVTVETSEDKTKKIYTAALSSVVVNSLVIEKQPLNSNTNNYKLHLSPIDYILEYMIKCPQSTFDIQIIDYSSDSNQTILDIPLFINSYTEKFLSDSTKSFEMVLQSHKSDLIYANRSFGIEFNKVVSDSLLSRKDILLKIQDIYSNVLVGIGSHCIFSPIDIQSPSHIINGFDEHSTTIVLDEGESDLINIINVFTNRLLLLSEYVFYMDDGFNFKTLGVDSTKQTSYFIVIDLHNPTISKIPQEHKLYLDTSIKDKYITPTTRHKIYNTKYELSNYSDGSNNTIYRIDKDEPLFKTTKLNVPYSVNYYKHKLNNMQQFVDLDPNVISNRLEHLPITFFSFNQSIIINGSPRQLIQIDHTFERSIISNQYTSHTDIKYMDHY